MSQQNYQDRPNLDPPLANGGGLSHSPFRGEALTASSNRRLTTVRSSTKVAASPAKAGGISPPPFDGEVLMRSPLLLWASSQMAALLVKGGGISHTPLCW